MSKQRTFYDAKAQKEREIKFSDITLLCRGRTEAVREITQTISSYGIPVAQISKGDIFLEYEIQFLVSYLRLIYNPHDDINLINLLVCPMIGMNEDELASIRVKTREKGEDESLNFAEFYISALHYAQNNEDVIAQKLKKAFDLIEEGRKIIENGTIFHTLNYFCQRTDYLSFVCAMIDGKTRVNNVLGFINSFVDKAYNTDLVEFILNLDKISASFEVTPEPDVGVNCVNVETMHHSKGLEYPIVFLIDMGHNFNTEEQNGDFLLNSNLGVGLFKYDSLARVKSPTLSLGAVKVAMINKAYAENVRLLYVAMTRAKNNLFITGSADLEKIGSSLAPFALKTKKNFLELLLSCCGDNPIREMQAGGSHVEVDIGSKNKLNVNLFDKISEIALAENKVLHFDEFGDQNAKFNDLITKNEHYVYKFCDYVPILKTTSVTKLNQQGEHASEDYEDDEYLTNQEEESIARGIAYHKVMEHVDFSASREQVLQLINHILDENGRKLVDIDKIMQAIEKLKDLVNGGELLREQSFLMRDKHASVVNDGVNDEIIIHGIIDLVIIKENEVILLDYKTSDTKNVEKTAQNYVTQLSCYAKAIEKTLHLPVTKKFLYFFLQERLILVDI